MSESARILVVDDDEVILVALERLLKRQGYDVIIANKPSAAYRIICEAEHSERPIDLVLSDYRMPEMVGSELLAKVAEVAPDAARLLITANTEFETISDAVNRGGIHRVVAKPWRPHDLYTAVAEGARLANLQRENRRLAQAVQRQNELLKVMNEQLDRKVHERTSNLLDGLISALDFRDTETQLHSRRVSLYARRLADALGLQEPVLTVIEQGALLHDIGKIGVRDSVLLKPSKLTQEEWEEMKQHARIGYHLLAPIEFLKDASRIVLHHHEQFDGSGYPQGIGDGDIVLGARIFAVVDTYDAMTSDRPYRKAQEPAVARAEILRCAGQQFDPEVVQAFLSVEASEWVAIRENLERAHRERRAVLERTDPMAVLPAREAAALR